VTRVQTGVSPDEAEKKADKIAVQQAGKKPTRRHPAGLKEEREQQIVRLIGGFGRHR